jgi:hypothetical protein
MANDDGNHNFRVSPTVMGVVFALLAQLGGLIVWATSEHNARVSLQDRVGELEKRATDLNRAQDERLGRLDEFLRTLNDKQNVVNTSDSARIDAINGHLTRMDDRIDRIVQALDQTYNLLNQHLREHNRDGNK